MSRFEPVEQWLRQDREGYSLPRGLYVSDEAFAFDTEAMLKSVWLYACTVAHVKNPGEYFVFELASNSVIVVRGRDGEVRAFWNSCRHRGAQICQDQRGRAPRLTCPYHQWTLRPRRRTACRAQHGAWFRQDSPRPVAGRG